MNSTSLLEDFNLSDNATDNNGDATVVTKESDVVGGQTNVIVDENAGSADKSLSPEASPEERPSKKRKVKKEMDPEEFRKTSLLKLRAAIDKIWSMTSHTCRTNDGDFELKTDSKGQFVFKAKCLKCPVWFTAQRSEYCFKVGNYKKHVSTFHMATSSATSSEISSSGKGSVQKSVFGFLEDQGAKKAIKGLAEPDDGVVEVEDELEALFNGSEVQSVLEGNSRGKPEN